MTRSYIKPRSKHIISDDMQLVLLFFFISIAMLFLTYGFLKLRIYTFEESVARSEAKKVELKSNIEQMEHRIGIIQQESERSEKVGIENGVLKESIKNLLDLIPDRITLIEVELDKNSLVLKGITPSKDVYEFLLQAPLRSIFNNTYTSFYQAQNGWLNFVSTNTIDDESVLK
jgi:hypothetical protein